MASEVESILVEIREQVRAAEQAGRATTGDTHALQANEHSENGSSREASESLARLSAHLTTTARAWDRLPPVMSNRTGLSARVELWIKGSLKKLARWFTWEQINFNAAVHRALIDTETL